MIRVREVNPYHPDDIQYELMVEDEVGTLEDLGNKVMQALYDTGDGNA